MNRTARSTDSATPLARSSLQVTITDLVAEYELRHVFRNEDSESIEAIYSFPVPLDSAFMGMQATLGGETLAAQIVSSRQATRDYDDAMADGNSAVLLERLEPGMLCVNLGNLKSGEEGEIALRFAAPLSSADGTVRFSLPLVHRPRYGRSELDELVEPQHDFAVEHPLEAVIRVEGLLARAPVNCATHGARFSVEGDSQVLRLTQAMLDRDLVLVFDLPQSFVGQARLVRDGDAAIGIISFNAPSTLRAEGPCDLCLVLDGSGSMSGDAIRQSRAALQAVAEALDDADRIQVLRFGSTIVPLFRRLMKATDRVKSAMDEWAETVESDLGGTDMGEALDRAIDSLVSTKPAVGRRQAVILVTDGAIHPSEIKAAQIRANQTGIRIFVVAVGSSAGADVLGPLATSTHGAMERAVPAEPIDESVMRQLRRARDAGPVAVKVDWGTQDAEPIAMEEMYAGDAATVVAMLPGGRAFDVQLRLGNGSEVQRFELAEALDAPALRALAGHMAWQHAEEAAREALALRFGLVTDETSAVLVKVRADDEKVEGLPTVVPVAHMLPAGMVCAELMELSSNRTSYLDLASVVTGYKEQRSFASAVAKCTPTMPRRNLCVVDYKTDQTGRPILPDGYEPTVDEEYMSLLQLEYFRQRLLKWRAELVEELTQATENTEDGVRDRIQKLIAKIDLTIGRLDSGDYGYCTDTGEEIGLDRLKGQPTAERTVDAQERWEQLLKDMGETL